MKATVALRIETAVIAVAILAGLAHRLVFGWQAPLWLDEAYTGVIASQPDIAGLFAWCREELSGPFFYAALWAWEKIAGDSNLALRLPSAIASCAAIALVVLWGMPDRRERWIWAGLTAVWLPGLMFVAQARPQAILFLLATIQAIAFLRCIETPRTRWLVLWSAMGACMILTHIHATVITGLQLLCLAWVHRTRLRGLWPALPFFIPVAAWLPLQFSFMTGILKPGAAWYPLLGVGDLLRVPVYLFAANLAAFAVAAIVLGILGVQWAQRRSTATPLPYSRAEAMLTLTALLSIALVIAAGFLRPTFVPRYLVPFMPGVLFGLTIVLARTRLLLGLLPSLVLLAWSGAAVQNATAYAGFEAQQSLNPLEYQRGSDWLMAKGTRRVLFVWDNPSSALSGPERQAEIAGFFFRRAGYPAQVRAAFLDPAWQTPDHLAALADRGDAAILWIGGAARLPAGLRTKPGFDCRDWGDTISRSIACARR